MLNVLDVLWFILRGVLGISYVVAVTLVMSVMIDLCLSTDHERVLELSGSLVKAIAFIISVSFLLSFVFPFTCEYLLNIIFAVINVLFYVLVVLFTIRVYVAQVQEDIKNVDA